MGPRRRAGYRFTACCCPPINTPGFEMLMTIVDNKTKSRGGGQTAPTSTLPNLRGIR